MAIPPYLLGAHPWSAAMMVQAQQQQQAAAAAQHMAAAHHHAQQLAAIHQHQQHQQMAAVQVAAAAQAAAVQQAACAAVQAQQQQVVAAQAAAAQAQVLPPPVPPGTNLPEPITDEKLQEKGIILNLMVKFIYRLFLFKFTIFLFIKSQHKNGNNCKLNVFLKKESLDLSTHKRRICLLNIFVKLSVIMVTCLLGNIVMISESTLGKSIILMYL